MAKVLVVYYTRGGTTFRVAEAIARALGADLEGIMECSPRTGKLGYLRSLLEAVAKGLPTIRTRRDPRAYDLVILGTPVWAGTISSPMRAYLHAQRTRLPSVALFATMAGRGAQGVLEEMQAFCDVDGVPTYFATEHDVRNGLTDEAIAPFLEEVRAVLSRPASMTTAA